MSNSIVHGRHHHPHHASAVTAVYAQGQGGYAHVHASVHGAGHGQFENQRAVVPTQSLQVGHEHPFSTMEGCQWNQYGWDSEVNKRGGGGGYGGRGICEQSGRTSVDARSAACVATR